MAEMVGPDGQAPRFDGAAWVSQDGRHFWNGAAWQPIVRPSSRPSGLVIFLAVAVAAIVVFVLYTALKPKPFEGEGVSNAKMDSPTQIEFDYGRSSTCNQLTFEYKFFNSSNQQVDDFSDTSSSRVVGGPPNFSTHFTIHADPQKPINSSAVRFEADATCND